MDQRIEFERLYATVDRDRDGFLALFALVNLGVIESLAAGSLGAAEAVNRLYFADNCLFVRTHLNDRTADRIMGHGVQLPDLFEALPAEEAHREFLRELATMRRLCLQLLDRRRRVA